MNIFFSFICVFDDILAFTYNYKKDSHTVCLVEVFQAFRFDLEVGASLHKTNPNLAPAGGGLGFVLFV